jgi:hypothetical protein
VAGRVDALEGLMLLLGPKLKIKLRGMNQTAELQPSTDGIEATEMTIFDRFEISWGDQLRSTVPLSPAQNLMAGDTLDISGEPREHLAQVIYQLIEDRDLVSPTD